MTRRPTFFLLLAFLPCILLLSACGMMDALSRPVDTAAADAQVQQLRQALTDLNSYVGTLEGQLADAKTVAEQSKSETAIAYVGKLQAVLDAAKAHIPEVEKLVADGETAVADLKKAGPTVPLWGVLVTLALPFVAPAAAGIPGIGPVVAPILGKIANGAWEAYATRQQKDADAAVQAKAAALAHQVDVTRKLLPLVPIDDAEPILDAAKQAQKAAGLHLVLRQAVAESEDRAQVESKAA